MTDYSLERGQWETLKALIEDDVVSRWEQQKCNVQEADRVGVRRVGAEKSRLAGRVQISTRVGGTVGGVYVAAPQARILAAALLNAADELDGVTPLALLPRFPDEPVPAETIAEAEEPEERFLAARIVQTVISAPIIRIARWLG